MILLSAQRTEAEQRAGDERSVACLTRQSYCHRVRLRMSSKRDARARREPRSRARRPAARDSSSQIVCLLQRALTSRSSALQRRSDLGQAVLDDCRHSCRRSAAPPSAARVPSGSWIASPSSRHTPSQTPPPCWPTSVGAGRRCRRPILPAEGGLPFARDTVPTQSLFAGRQGHRFL